jgi:ribosomal protein S12 methylthiotransferase accessory factor
MQINVKYLDNLKLNAKFDDFEVPSDQPIRYKGDGTAPGPFDYFLASSVMCAAYFVKVYCNARNISTEEIYVSQNNIVDPNNRYKQTFNIIVQIPEYIAQKDREGMIKSIERCTVKRTIQEGINFNIETKVSLTKETNNIFDEFKNKQTQTSIPGKDKSLEDTINEMTNLLDQLGIKIEISSWRNPVPNVWSVHIRDADCPMNYTNGKGSTKESALCSALGEYLERLSTNYFYADYYFGDEMNDAPFSHYPTEKWFKNVNDKQLPSGILDQYTTKIYNPNSELKFEHLIDTNSSNKTRGICALPFIRQSDKKKVYFPVNIIGNLYVSNGMSAGNSKYEARVQCLSEIFERAVKNKIILDEISLPDIPEEILKNYTTIYEGITALRKKGFPLVIKDASLGGIFPVLCITLLNPETGGAFCSFGAHPNFEIALERCLTELLQGRSFEGLNEMPPPSFNYQSVSEPNNIIDHFIDSTGVVSWKFFRKDSNYTFCHWNFSGSTQDEFNYLMSIFQKINKEVYISDLDELGCYACRIIVPGYSEIYPVDDLIWDNNNKGNYLREKILNIHHLSDEELKSILLYFEEEQYDDFMPISELIGVSFDENSSWGELTVIELKALINLALKEIETSKECIDLFFTFNDANGLRNKLYRIISILIQINIETNDSITDYEKTLKLLYGEDLFEKAMKIITSEIRFFGLDKTDSNFKNNKKHLKLISSLKKLHTRRDKILR